MQTKNLQNFIENGGGKIETPIPESEPDVVEITPKTPRSKTRKGRRWLRCSLVRMYTTS